MSGRQAAGAGRGGGRGRSRGGRGRSGGRGFSKKKKKHAPATTELSEAIFDCGKPGDVALFEKSKKAIVNYLRMSTGKEAPLAAQAIEQMAPMDVPQPPMPPQIPDPNQPNANPPVMIDDVAGRIIWEGELKGLAGRRNNLADRLIQAYAIIWDQCSPTVKSKLEQLDNYDQVALNKDPVELLDEIKNIICGRERHKPPVYSMVELIRSLATFYQKDHKTNEQYKEEFESLWEMVEQQGGSMVNHPGLIADRAIDIAVSNGRVDPNQNDTDLAATQVANECKAAFMLNGANDDVHELLKDRLRNDFVIKKDDHYPTHTADVLTMMNEYSGSKGGKKSNNRRDRKRNPRGNDDEDGVNFAQERAENENEGEGDQQQGANFLQGRGQDGGNRQSQPTGGGRRAQRQNQQRAKPSDKAKEAARKQKEMASHVASPPKCLHCEGEHILANCPDLTDEQLGQILVQIIGAEEDDEEESDERIDGGSLQQVRGKGKNADQAGY